MYFSSARDLAESEVPAMSDIGADVRNRDERTRPVATMDAGEGEGLLRVRSPPLGEALAVDPLPDLLSRSIRDGEDERPGAKTAAGPDVSHDDGCNRGLAGRLELPAYGLQRRWAPNFDPDRDVAPCATRRERAALRVGCRRRRG